MSALRNPPLQFVLLCALIFIVVWGCILGIPWLQHWSCATFGQCNGLIR